MGVNEGEDLDDNNDQWRKKKRQRASHSDASSASLTIRLSNLLLYSINDGRVKETSRQQPYQ
jgi:hypothetical protein